MAAPCAVMVPRYTMLVTNEEDKATFDCARDIVGSEGLEEDAGNKEFMVVRCDVPMPVIRSVVAREVGDTLGPDATIGLLIIEPGSLTLAQIVICPDLWLTQMESISGRNNSPVSGPWSGCCSLTVPT